MRTPTVLSAAVAAVVCAWSLAGCTGKAPDQDATAGCAKDTDCKGARVCVSGKCQDAPAGTQPPAATTGPAATTAPAATPAPAQPAATPTFRAVPEAEWKPVIGPRLRIGAVVAHQVFEGPFGPSATSWFVVTREGADFVATVWADGRGYRNAPLANNGGTPAKIPAVSFFDADEDGKMDALVMATYTPSGGGPDRFDNVMLRWKAPAVVRMPNLEVGIAGLESVTAVRAKLKK